jgi:sigma-E factor negative regulatory protein RseC
MKKKRSAGTIQHEGTVQKVNSDSVDVRIVSESACAGCHAAGYCNLSGREDKILNVTGKYNVVSGDPVTVIIKESMGFKAVVLGYLLPLIIIITSLILLSVFSVPELVAGILSVAILGPYFIILYFFRNRIDRSFTFTLKT